MKQKFRRPDGTEVEVEGTPEELAEYERQIKEGQKPVSIGKKKPVLRGAEVDGQPLSDEEITLIRLSRAGLLPKEGPAEKRRDLVPWLPMPQPIVVPQWPDKYWLQDQPCKWCGQLNCNQVHIICKTVTTTSDNTLQGGLTCSQDVQAPPYLGFRDVIYGCNECGSESHNYCARD